MKRSEFLKIIAGLWLTLPSIALSTLPETIVLDEMVYDEDAERLIGRLEKIRDVYDNEKTAIRYYFKEAKKGCWFNQLDSLYVFRGQDEDFSRINWVNPDARYDLK